MSKQKVIDEFVNQNAGGTFKTSQICELCNVTLPTVLTYIKQNPSRFTKVKRGIYTINTTLANIIQSIADNQLLENSTNLKTFDWDEL